MAEAAMVWCLVGAGTWLDPCKTPPDFPGLFRCKSVWWLPLFASLLVLFISALSVSIFSDEYVVIVN